MRFFLSCLCLPLALALLAGCGTPPEERLDSPGVEITGLTTTPKGAYVLALRVSNSNTVPLVVSRSTHTLHLGSQRIDRFDDRTPVGVPPLGAVTHSVKLPAKLSDDVRAWLAQHPGTVTATVETAFEVVVGTDNDTITLKSTGRGTVTAP